MPDLRSALLSPCPIQALQKKGCCKRAMPSARLRLRIFGKPSLPPRVFTTRRRVMTTLARVFTTLRRVIGTLERVFTTLGRVIGTLARVFTTLRRVIGTLGRVFTTLRRVIGTLGRVFTTLSLSHPNIVQAFSSRGRCCGFNSFLQFSKPRIMLSQCLY